MKLNTPAFLASPLRQGKRTKVSGLSINKSKGNEPRRPSKIR
jgi:hypothetical protein